MSRFIVIGAEEAPASFPSHRSAVNWVLREYGNWNVMHVTPSRPGEVDIERLDSNTFRITGSWVGDEPMILEIALLQRRTRYLQDRLFSV